MARFFIDRPVFAWVIALVIMIAGGLSLWRLPVAQFPNVAPPTVRISAKYPGASAKTAQDSVVQVIEQRMNGLDGLLYMTSNSDSSGSAQIRLTFSADTNPDVAQMQVQNKLQLAMSRLPQEVQRQGLSVSKSGESLLKTYAFVAEGGDLTPAAITDYVGTDILDAISRLSGVGEVSLYGSQYGMRIWLNPYKLRRYQLMPSDVVAAIKAQNAQISAGELGGAPIEPGQQTNLGISVQDRFTTSEQFANVLLRTNPDGSVVRVRDIARVELGNDSYSGFSRYNGQPSAGLAVRLSSDANALETAARVDDYLDSVKPFFPEGLVVVDQYDSTLFVRISIGDVFKTLVEAVALVFIIMYLFLQSFRATLIPTIAVPVVLLGTFGVLSAFGYSINTLTMFAMVLAIGLLVDDAIVVVENVERIMREERLSPREATRKTMNEITGALVGIVLVLSAVFVPMAFFGGSVGIIYRQFSVTIVSAMVLSVIVAIVLTPALCAIMLRPPHRDGEDGHGHAQHGFFGWFNRGMERFTSGYQGWVAKLIRRVGRFMLLYVVLCVGMFLLFRDIPTGFLPDEDQGSVSVQIQLPTGSTFEQTLKVVEEVERYVLDKEPDAMQNVMGVVGFANAGSGQNVGQLTIRLKPWDQRTDPSLKAQAVAARLSQFCAGIRNAQVYASIPPAISQMGNASGFNLFLQDRAGFGHEALTAARAELLRLARQSPGLANVRVNGQDDRPQLRVLIDREKAGSMGLELSEVNAALSTIWGSSYADDYLDKGRIKKVYVQGDGPFRMAPEDMEKWYFRNKLGDMVPFSSFATAKWEFAPARLQRYNGIAAQELLGAPAPGYSTGEAMLEMERLMGQLPAGYGYEWTGLSYQEMLSGSQAPLLFALSALVVFLALSALYESWSVPLSVILIVPLGVLGALIAVSLRGMTNDVYLQVGLLTTMGLAAKNAILIVEFAKSLTDGGMELLAATVEAARLRLRPILMTSLAFLLGVLPLAVSTGAGAGGQNAIGTAVLGGTFFATLMGIYAVPVFFVVVTRVFAWRPWKARKL